MNKHFAAGFNSDFLYVAMKDDESCKVVTYSTSNLNTPIEIEEIPSDTDVLSVMSFKGVSEIPSRILRGRIGERLALYREIVEFNAISNENLPSGYQSEFEAKSAFMHSFANERPQLARAISTIVEDIEYRSQNGIHDTPSNAEAFANALYSFKPEFAPTTISRASTNKSPTQYQQPMPTESEAKPESENRSPSDKKPWFFLDESGIFLSYSKVEGVGEKLILIDRNGMADPEKLEAIHFMKPNWTPEFERNIYFLDSEDRSINKSQLAEACNLAKCQTALRTPEEIEDTFREQLKAQQSSNRSKVSNGSLYLGTNAEGDKVYKQIAEGYRWIQTQSGNYFRPQFDGLKPSTGLYGFASFSDKVPDNREIVSSLSGLIEEHLNGSKSSGKKSYEDISKLLFDTENPSKELVHKVGEIYEYALNSYLSTLHSQALKSGNPVEAERTYFNRLVQIYQNQPVKEIKSLETINSGQYSTPVPMAYLAQKLLIGKDNPISGYSVLEPTIGNGSLTNSFANAQVYGIEMDANRFGIISLNNDIETLKDDATTVDFKNAFKVNDGFDYVITNPPFAALDKDVIFDGVLKTGKLDHLIALRALDARKDTGRSVMIIGSDGIYSKGKAKGSSQYLINYLASRYELIGGAEFDSQLYAKNGANTNVRMLVVGDRLTTPVENDRLGEERGLTDFRVLKNYDEAYEWANSLIGQYNSIKREYSQLQKNEPEEIEIDFSGITAGVLTLAEEEIPQVNPEPDNVVEQVDEEIEADFSNIVVGNLQFVQEEFGKTQIESKTELKASNQENTESIDSIPFTEPDAQTLDTPEDKEIELSLDLFGDADNVPALQNQTNSRLNQNTVIDESNKPSLVVTDLKIGLPIDQNQNQIEINERQQPPSTTINVKNPAIVENEYQSTYLPKSQVGIAKSMIPINMSAATYGALDKVVDSIINGNWNDADGNKIDNIDDWVANRLEYTRDDLGKFFSPEQVDAIALGIYNHDNGRGIINADQTGQGKGRFVAAMMRFAKIEGSMPVFATYKPELFTDIYRDISEIGSLDLFQHPFTFNNADIRKFDNPNEVLFPKLKSIEHKNAIESGHLPENTDLVLITYSQLAKAADKSQKVRSFAHLMASRNATLFLDESHLAAGESLTGENVRTAVEDAQAVIYSSATPLKQVKHYGVYSRVFPKSVDIEKLPETLQKGGEALQEAISTAMAEDGVLVRRERDFSQVTFATLEPNEEQEIQIRETADQIAHVLSMMARLSSDVSADAHKMNEEFEAAFEKLPDASKSSSGRMRANSMNFGSRIYHLNRQFLLGSKIDMVAKHTIACIKNNTKPVIGVESTAGSLLEQMVKAKVLSVDEISELDVLKDKPKLSDREAEILKELKLKLSNGSNDLEFDEPPQYKDYLKIMLDRLGTITVKNGFGKVEEVIINSEPSFLSIKQMIENEIEKLPQISLSPLDIIREKLSEDGYKMAEISGRTKGGLQHLVKMLVDDPDKPGKKAVWKLNNFPKADHSVEIGKFQNGEFDVAVVTRSGSTGYSLHATDKYENSDCRQRNFIGLEKAANIADYLQWIGRVDRTGQVVPPIITSVESGLPAERRITMMHNSKLRKLSANTTSNRDNSNMEEEVDLLNNVGDEVALRFLMQNQSLAKELDIKIPEGEDGYQLALEASSDNQYINRLMGRLVLLPVEEQENTIYSLESRFAERVIELDAEGKNPFKVDVYDWMANEVNNQIMDDYNEFATDSSFDAPLNVVELQFEVKHNPISDAALNAAIEHGKQKLFNHEWLSKYPELTDKDSLEGFADLAAEKILTRALKTLPKSVAEDWFDDKPENLIHRKWRFDDGEQYSFVKSQVDRAQFLKTALWKLKPGEPIIIVNELYEPQVGIVTGIQMPRNQVGMSALSNYEVKVAIAGQEQIKATNLATLFSGLERSNSEGQPMFVNIKDRAEILEEFKIINESAADKSYTKNVTVLKDNLFKAVELAAERKFGRPILYTDGNGHRQRAVLLRAGTTIEDVTNGPVKLSTNQIEQYVRQYLSDKYSSDERYQQNTYPIFTSNSTTAMNSFNFKAVITPDKVLLDFKDPKKNLMKTFTNDSRYFVVKGEHSSTGMNIKAYGNNKSMTATVSHEDFLKMLNNMKKDKYLQNMFIQNGRQEIMEELKNNLSEQKKGRRNTAESSMSL